MDHRSFTLNFEVNAFIYDEGIARSLKQAFIEDMKVSDQLTKENMHHVVYGSNLKKVYHNSYLLFYNTMYSTNKI